MAAPQLPSQSQDSASTDIVVARERLGVALERALEIGDPEGALRLLNARTHHRFTALHRFEPLGVWCVLHFDRDTSTTVFTPRRLAPQESYSVIVQHSERPFFTESSEHDARILGHPARGSILSYAGVPVRDGFGLVRGALCHYDHRPRSAPRSEIEALDRAAPHFERWLR